jgi:hypothetical protein
MPLSDFDHEAWSQLAPPERVAQCHRMADELFALSKETSSDAKVIYIELARTWERLAHELERSYYAKLRETKFGH